jgi:hypothetical protein
MTTLTYQTFLIMGTNRGLGCEFVEQLRIRAAANDRCRRNESASDWLGSRGAENADVSPGNFVRFPRSRMARVGSVWVPETLRTSCGLLIFVEEAAEAVVSLDRVDLGRRAVGECPCGGCLAQAAVPALIVVVAFELA